MERTDTDSKKRIQAAKAWLSKAEQAYAEDSSAKGQLQVMLAKAELRRLEESAAPSIWRRNRKALVALGCVVIIGVAYAIGPLGHHPAPTAPKHIDTTATTEATTPAAVQSAAPATVSTSPKGDTATAPPTSEVTASQDATATATTAPSAPAVEATHSADTTVQKSAVSETSVMSDSQIRAAVRDGGRSLRGQ